MTGNGYGLGPASLRQASSDARHVAGPGKTKGTARSGSRQYDGVPSRTARAGPIMPNGRTEQPTPARDRMIRVVVVDDEPMVCAHLRTISARPSDIEGRRRGPKTERGRGQRPSSQPARLVLMKCACRRGRASPRSSADFGQARQTSTGPSGRRLTHLRRRPVTCSRAARGSGRLPSSRSKAATEPIGWCGWQQGHTVSPRHRGRRLESQRPTTASHAREHDSKLVGTLTEREGRGARAASARELSNAR